MDIRGMTFTDDELREWKSFSSENPLVTIHLEQLAALLYRLEAAEKVCQEAHDILTAGLLRLCKNCAESCDGCDFEVDEARRWLEDTVPTWRKAVGK